ncbi:GNAT family N-acetyltransferase [Leifsonia sp. NPDC058230]|uniref:GNAT family N-acetyltransferase n=1 Tax=Leifsonia sp. NPDC058230 TaxID=3346391 RepID=UPI0036DE978A
MHVLDNTAWNALTGAHAAFAVGDDHAKRYRADVSPFAAVADPADPRAWTHLAQLVGPGEVVGVYAPGTPAPREGWRTVGAYDALQLVYTADRAPVTPDTPLVELGDADVAEMTDLVERTKPGPFLPRTIEFGGYRGVRVGGQLAAMAGQRMRPDGWCEVSAVCTDPDFRGRGYAARVMAAVIEDILERGERPFLHVERANERAVSVYEKLGFERRSDTSILVLERL